MQILETSILRPRGAIARSTLVSLLAGVVCIASLVAGSALAQGAYQFEVIAQTGMSMDTIGTANALGSGPSINNLGAVAFTACDARPCATSGGQEGVFVHEAGLLDERAHRVDSFSHSPGAGVSLLTREFAFGQDLQLNDQGRVVWRARSHDGFIGFILRLGSTAADFKVVAKTHLALGGSTSPFEGSGFPADGLLPWATLSNLGRTAFTGIRRADPGNTYLATPVDFDLGGTDLDSDYHFPNAAPPGGTVGLFPMITDNSETVLRGGGSNSDPLLFFLDETLSTAFPINAIAMGQKPGASDDGVMLAYVADDASLGFGIFGEATQGIFKVAGISGDGRLDPGESWSDINSNGSVDPGEDSGPFTNFSLLPRVGTNHDTDAGADIYTFAYLANSNDGGQMGPVGLYASRVDATNRAAPSISAPLLVLESGSPVPGLGSTLPGTVTNFGLYDPVNEQGEIAFFVETSTGAQAILRATSAPVCLDDLTEYRQADRPCVFRRGSAPVVRFAVPDGATDVALSVTDPSQNPVAASVSVNGGIASARIEAGLNAAVGRYEVRGQYMLAGQPRETATTDLYLIFEPPGLSSGEIDTYLYDESGTLDTQVYRVGFNSEGHINFGGNPRIKSWEELSLDLDQFGGSFFEGVMRAVGGETDPTDAATTLMNAISNLIAYTTPNDGNSVATIFGGVTPDDFGDAANGTEIDTVLGECREYAAALTAALRATGIPARVTVAILRNQYNYHQWTEAYVGGTWTVFDAMDTGSMPDDPVGMDSPNDAPFKSDAFEVIVGDEGWLIDGGAFELEEMPGPPRQVAFVAPTPAIESDDALFEKCGGNPIGYPGGRYPPELNTCPAPDPYTPIVSLSFDQVIYRPGDTVTMTAVVSNPDVVDRSASLDIRVFSLATGEDGRSALGDPIIGIVGSGVLGTTIWTAPQENFIVPAQTSVELDFMLTLSDSSDFSLEYFAEAVVGGAIGVDTLWQGFEARPSFESDLAVLTASPGPGDLLSLELTLQNEAAVPLDDVEVSLALPPTYSTVDPLDQSEASLGVGASRIFSWTVRPRVADVPTRLRFEYSVSTANGGTIDAIQPLELLRPATPRLALLSGPSDVAPGQPFSLVFEVTNTGDASLVGATATLSLSPGLSLPGSDMQAVMTLDPGESSTLPWDLVSLSSDVHTVELSIAAASSEPETHTVVVPEPHVGIALLTGLAQLLALSSRRERRRRIG